MRETLEALGWTMYYECRTCGWKQYFTHADHPGYEIRCKLKSQTFHIISQNQHAGGPFWAYQLKDKLTEYGIKS